MKSEIAVFMAMKKGSWVFHGIFMKKRFVVMAQSGKKTENCSELHLFCD